MFAALLVVATAITFVASARLYVGSQAAVQQTLVMRQAISGVLSLLKDAETGQRGFLLTRDEKFLQPYTRASQELPQQLALLHELSRADAEQARDASEVQALSITKLAELAETVHLAGAGLHEQALAIVREGRGRRTMDSLRDATSQMLEREALLLYERESLAESRQRDALLALWSAVGVVFALLALSLFMVQRDVNEVRLINTRLQASEQASRAAQDELRAQTARLTSVLENMGDGVVVLDAQRRFLVVNPAAREYIRQDEGETSPNEWSQLHQVYLPDGSAFFPLEQGPMLRALQGESVHAVELAIRDRQDNMRSFSVTAQAIRDAERVVGCVAVYRDTTEQRLAARQLEESQRRWRVLSEASFEGVAITQTGIVVDCNSNLARWLGTQPEELIGKVGLDLFATEDRDHVDEMSSQVESAYEAHMLRADGTSFPIEVRGRVAEFRGEPVRIAVIRDITERKQHESELERRAQLLRDLALRDELTGLFNRRGFLEFAGQALLVVARNPRPACVLYADVNGLKAINDGLGHDVGDRAIVAAARSLREVLRESDIVARLGGDEFAVFAIDCSREDLAAIRGRLRDALREFNAQSGEPFTLAISVGAAEYSSVEPKSLAQLMELADKRMYEEKPASPVKTRTARAADR
ncbi:MAG TPA: diguanylate cyclase [Polyangiales bacterium]|nr:diguanylate cyclase [Polyangiales bacterium]